MFRSMMVDILAVLLLVAGTSTVLDARPFSRACRDTFHSCDSWSKSGMCGDVKFGFVMRGGCAKTCGFCKEGSGGIQTLETNHAETNSEKTTHDASPTVGHPGAQPSSNSDKRHDTEPTTATVTTLATTTTTTTATTTPTTPTTSSNINEDECRDIFPKCEIWKKEKKICDNTKLKPYLKFGCANSCGFCSKDELVSTTPAPMAATATTPTRIPPDKEGSSDSPKSIVEIGIAKEIIARTKEKVKEAGHRNSKPHGEKGISKRSKVPKSGTEPNSKRVQIEAGDREPSPFTPLGDFVNGEDKITLNHAGFVQRPNVSLLENFDDLESLPGLTEGKKDLKMFDKDSGKFLTPEKTDNKFDYFADHYSNDPYIAEYQREEWMKDNTGALKTYRRRLKTSKGKQLNKPKKQHKRSDAQHWSKK